MRASGAPTAIRLLASAHPLACVLSVVVPALWRSTLKAPPPTFLLRDRDGRFLGEVGAAAGQASLGYWPVDERRRRAWSRPRSPSRTAASGSIRASTRSPWRAPCAEPRASGRRVSGASTLAMQVARMQNPGRARYRRKAVEAVTAVLLTARYGREECSPLPAHRALRQPHPRHRLRRAPLPRQAGRGPVLGRDRVPGRDPAGAGRMNPFHPAGRARAVARGERILDALRRARRAHAGRARAGPARRSRELRIPAGKGRRAREALHAVLRLERDRCAASGPARRCRSSSTPRSTSSLQQEASWLTATVARALGEPRRRQRRGDRRRPRSRRGARLGRLGRLLRRAPQAGAIDYTRVRALRRQRAQAVPLRAGARARRHHARPPSSTTSSAARAASTTPTTSSSGPLLPRVALANSRNVPAVELLDRLGLDEGYAFLRELGLHDGALPARALRPGPRDRRPAGDARAAGRAPTPRSPATAACAGCGWHRGQELPPPRADPLRGDGARQIALFLSDPQARLPTFPRMGAAEYPFPVAVKTGTSSASATPGRWPGRRRYLVGVWVGHPDFRPMNRLSGYRSAAELVQQMLLVLHRDQTDGLDDLAFPPPRGLRPARVCALTGRRATDACDRVFLEWFRPGEEPVDDCPAHQHRAVDRRNGLLATARHAALRGRAAHLRGAPAALRRLAGRGRPSPAARDRERLPSGNDGTGDRVPTPCSTRRGRPASASPPRKRRPPPARSRNPGRPLDPGPDRRRRPSRPPGRLVRRRPALRDGGLPVHDALEADARETTRSRCACRFRRGRRGRCGWWCSKTGRGADPVTGPWIRQAGG